MMNTLRHPGRKGSLLALSLVFLAFSAFSTAQAGEIKNVMKDMKVAMKGAMNSSSIAEFSKYSTRLQSDAVAANKLQYQDDPATYHKGMQELQKELDTVNQAVRANDLTAAKAALQKINGTKKHYHDLLG